MTELAYTYDKLAPEFRKKAEKELGEKPQQVRAHIASLRRWLTSMPHLKCRTDDEFLLRFLRIAKFDQSRAQMLLDNYISIRKSPKGSPQWFEYPKVDSPVVQEYLRHPFHIFLGHTADGEGVYVSSMKYWDMDKMSFDDVIRCIYMSVDNVQLDELTQISGIKVIVDLGQTDRKQLSFFENRKNFFNLMRNWQDAFPMRIRSVIYINEPMFFDVIFALTKNAPFLKEKFKRKLHKVGTDYNKLKKIIGVADAEKLLPTELGGKNGSMYDHMHKTLEAFKSDKLQQEWQLMQEMQVDESKRQPSTKDYLRSDDSADATTGITGTFTKLNVD